MLSAGASPRFSIGHVSLCTGCKKLVASSGGNAGMAVACVALPRICPRWLDLDSSVPLGRYAGKRLGVKVVIVVPESTPEMMYCSRERKCGWL